MEKIHSRLFAAAILVLCVIAAGSGNSFGSGYGGKIVPGTWNTVEVPYSGAEGTFSVKMQVYFPRKYSLGDRVPVMLLLHNYGSSMYEWGRNSAIAAQAEKYAVVLVSPDMGKTLYETEYFPETTLKWNPIPGGRWVAQVLVPYLRAQFDLALNPRQTAVAGVGYAARGAILLAESYPQLFGEAVGIGGCYDQLSMSRDQAITRVYGNYSDQSDRWKKKDNVIALAPALADTYVYLLHGDKDTVFPYQQAQLFAIRLSQLRMENKGKYNFKYSLKGYKMHEWDFWSSCLPEVMEYVNQGFSGK